MAARDLIIRIRAEVENAIKGLKRTDKAIDGVGDEAQESSGKVKNFNKEVNKTGKSFAGLPNVINQAKSALIGFIGIAASFQFVKGIVKTVDSFNLLQSRIKLVTDTTLEYVSANVSLFKIAQQTRTSFEEVVTLFVRTNQSLKALGRLCPLKLPNFCLLSLVATGF